MNFHQRPATLFVQQISAQIKTCNEKWELWNMQEGEKTGRGGVTEAPVELKTEYIHYLGSSSLWNMI